MWLLLFFVFSNRAYAGDFVDTRLTFTFSDDDVLHGPGETTPTSPGPGFGLRPGNLFFFDNYNTKFSGQESLAHLVLYKKFPSFFKRLTVESALVIKYDVIGSLSGERFNDDGSYIKLNVDFREAAEGVRRRGLSLTLFPFDTERFRLGYSYAISWAGGDIFPRRDGPAPGVRLHLDYDRLYAFVGAKSAVILNEKINEQQIYWGVLGGAGWDILDSLRVEFGAGYFDKGVNPRPAVLGKSVPAGGMSAQVTYHLGAPIQTSVDFRLYKNDPNATDRIFAPQKYDPGMSFVASSEFSWIWQVLEDPVVSGQTVRQNAFAGDFNLKFRWNHLRVFSDVVYRDLAYILYNVPSFVPYQDFPRDNPNTPETEKISVRPEFFFSVGADYHFKGPRLTPGFIVGVQWPSTFTAEITSATTGSVSQPDTSGTRTVVVRKQGDFTVLPKNATATPILAFKLTLRWDIGEYLALLSEVFYKIDNNSTRLKDDATTGIATRVFEEPYRLGFALMFQARY
ncbi:MAG: hypothetical protein HYY84_16925 [Deltaproteobacteria bacterium]|nr:hypothetical protein [Deltaproteobacteria bacterium]